MGGKGYSTMPYKRLTDGRIMLNVEDGAITVFTNAGLEEFFKRMFSRAKACISKDRKNAEHGIQVITWGTFYLESSCNRLFRDVLFSGISDIQLANSLWDVTRKINFLEKASVVVALSARNRRRVNHGKYLKKARELFELRNRLAHFKDKDQLWLEGFQVMKDESLVKAIRRIPHPPQPKLFNELTGRKIFSHARSIDEVYSWLASLFRGFSSYRGIASQRLSKKK